MRVSHIAESSPVLLLPNSAPNKCSVLCFVSTGPKSPSVSSWFFFRERFFLFLFTEDCYSPSCLAVFFVYFMVFRGGATRIYPYFIIILLWDVPILCVFALGFFPIRFGIFRLFPSLSGCFDSGGSVCLYELLLCLVLWVIFFHW